MSAMSSSSSESGRGFCSYSESTASDFSGSALRESLKVDLKECMGRFALRGSNSGS